jgi:glycosyltransferase involved in cell wall biosynthesis
MKLVTEGQTKADVESVQASEDLKEKPAAATSAGELNIRKYLLEALENQKPSTSQVDSVYLKKLEDRITELEKAVFLLDVHSLADYLKLRKVELINTLRKLFDGFFFSDDLKNGKVVDQSLFNQRVKNLDFLIKKSSDRRGRSNFLNDLGGQRVFIDVTNSMSRPDGGGIQRVVTQLASHGIQYGATPVIIKGLRLYAFDCNSNRIAPVNIERGDIFLMPDSSWQIEDLDKIMGSISTAGGINVSLIHDIIPIKYPEICVQEFVKEFKKWFIGVAVRSDALVCVTKSVADDIIDYASKAHISLPDSIGWSHHGCDISLTTEPRLSEDVARLVLDKGPILLSVSTVEPRKGYGIALDAMGIVWAKSNDVRYVIVGRYGWSSDALALRIRSHPEYGERLFWLEDASDSDLAALYRAAHSLVFPSVAEGFGLAVVEAARFDLPAVVSDIPVFREIGGDGTTFFEVANSNDLAEKLNEVLSQPKKAPNMSVLTWDQSTKNLLTIIQEGSYQYQQGRKIR